MDSAGALFVVPRASGLPAVVVKPLGFLWVFGPVEPDLLDLGARHDIVKGIAGPHGGRVEDPAVRRVAGRCEDLMPVLDGRELVLDDTRPPVSAASLGVRGLAVDGRSVRLVPEVLAPPVDLGEHPSGHPLVKKVNLGKQSLVVSALIDVFFFSREHERREVVPMEEAKVADEAHHPRRSHVSGLLDRHVVPLVDGADEFDERLVLKGVRDKGDDRRLESRIQRIAESVDPEQDVSGRRLSERSRGRLGLGPSTLYGPSVLDVLVESLWDPVVVFSRNH